MTNSHSTLRNLPKELTTTSWTVPIPFVKQSGRKDPNAKKDVEDKSSYITFNISLGNEDDDDEYQRRVCVFETGTPEEWCELREEMEDLIKLKKCQKDYNKQHVMWTSVLVGKAKETFNLSYTKYMAAQDKKDRDKPKVMDLVLKRCLNAVALQVFSQDGADSAKAQRFYMMANCSGTMGNQDPEKFADRLQKINNYIKWFPTKDALVGKQVHQPFPKETLLGILDMSKKREWNYIMMSQGKKPHSFEEVSQAVECYKQLYNADRLLQSAKDKHEASERKNKKGSKRGRDKQDQSKPKPCGICGKTHRGECWHKDGGGGKKSGGNPNKRFKKNHNQKSQQQSNMITLDKDMFQELMMAVSGNKKKKASRNSRAKDEESEVIPLTTRRTLLQ